MDPQTGSVGTWIAAADGSGAYQLAACMRQPDSRGDGRLVLNGEGCGTDSLWVMSADGSERWEVSRHPEDSHPSWSPDGGSVAYSSSHQATVSWSIFSHAIARDTPRSALPAPGHNRDPGFVAGLAEQRGDRVQWLRLRLRHRRQLRALGGQ